MKKKFKKKTTRTLNVITKIIEIHKDKFKTSANTDSQWI